MGSPLTPLAFPAYVSLWVYASLAPALLTNFRTLALFGQWMAGLCLLSLGIFWLFPTAVPAAGVTGTSTPRWRSSRMPMPAAMYALPCTWRPLSFLPSGLIGCSVRRRPLRRALPEVACNVWRSCGPRWPPASTSCWTCWPARLLARYSRSYRCATRLRPPAGRKSSWPDPVALAIFEIAAAS